MQIHKTAIIHENAKIGENVEVGPNTIINEHVKIGNGTKIAANVVIDGITEIGENCNIFTGAVIGTAPQDLKYKNEPTKVKIGNNTTIREYATVNRGTIARGETTLGNGCLLMAYVHIAHDCIVGDNVVLANNVTLAGHVTVEDRAIIGGLTPVHQFTRIGKFSMIGGGARVPIDMPPYCKATDSPIRLYGLNTIGLERAGFSKETISTLKKAYKILFRSKLNTTQALQALESQKELLSDEVQHLITFIKNSERGITKEK